MQITIPLTNVGKITKQLERLAARAAKLGLPPIAWTLGDVVLDRGQLCQAVTVEGDAPRLPGHTLIAVLTFETGKVGTREDHAGASEARELLRGNADVPGAREVAEDLIMVRTGIGYGPDDVAAADVEAALGGDAVPADVQGVRDLVTNLVAETCRPTVRTAPGEEPPERYLDAKPACDHCGYVRRRKTCYVLRHDETGEHRQIGSTCVDAYMGPGLAAMLAAYQSMMELGDREDVKRLPPKNFAIDTRAFVTICAAQIRIDGRYRRRQTGHDVWAALAAGDAIETTPEDAETADAAIAWAKEIEARGDWQRNVKAIAESPVVSRRRATLAASMVAGHIREQNTERTPLPPAPGNGAVHEASPKRLRSGGWGAWVRSDHVRAGDEIRVTTRAGRTWADEVLQVIWQGRDGAIVATVNG